MFQTNCIYSLHAKHFVDVFCGCILGMILGMYFVDVFWGCI